MENGILLTNGPIDKGDVLYDSRKKKMTVDLDPMLQHIDLIPLNGGQIKDGIVTFEEIIWSIPHKMPFAPLVFGFFYVTDRPSGITTSVEIGTFQKQSLSLVANAFGYGSELVELKADKDNVWLRHFVSGQNAAYKGNGSAVKFNFRYIITNLPDVTLNDKIRIN
jgi:hypothetical protein